MERLDLYICVWGGQKVGVGWDSSPSSGVCSHRGPMRCICYTCGGGDVATVFMGCCFVADEWVKEQSGGAAAGRLVADVALQTD